MFLAIIVPYALIASANPGLVRALVPHTGMSSFGSGGYHSFSISSSRPVISQRIKDTGIIPAA